MISDDDPARLRTAFKTTLVFVACLWVIRTLDFILGLELVTYGVMPRHLDGLYGVLWAPLIHGSWSHLLSNTPPLLVLGTTLLFGYPRAARILLPAIYFGAGVGVWLFARSSFHIGASGLTFGVMFFIFSIGVVRWDRRAIALSMIVFFLYGSMIWGLFPGDPRVSFETHFFGAAIGITLAVMLRAMDPPPPRKRYSWEDEDDTDLDLPEIAHEPGPDAEREPISDRPVETTDTEPDRNRHDI